MKKIILILVLACLGCKPIETTTVVNPKSIEPKSDASVDDELQKNLRAILDKTTRDRASDEYGKNKVETFIAECLKLHPNTQYHNIHTRPKMNCDDDCKRVRKWLDEAPFDNKFGATTEVAVEVAKTLQNRFNEDYKEIFQCSFSGAPHWEMLRGIEINGTLEESKKLFPELYK
jgi:hypothetical protein